jgi:hypothetical protein
VGELPGESKCHLPVVNHNLHVGRSKPARDEKSLELHRGGGGHDRPRRRRVRPTRDRRPSHSELGGSSGSSGSSGSLLHDHVSRPKDWGIGMKYKATYLGGEPGLVLLGALVRFLHPVGIGRAATALPLLPSPPPTFNTPPDISIWYVSFPK